MSRYLLIIPLGGAHTPRRHEQSPCIGLPPGAVSSAVIVKLGVAASSS